MLLRFNVRNFLSFNETKEGLSHEFSMISGRARGFDDFVSKVNGVKVLKFAAIYGANASGKSNLVKALDFFRHTIRGDLLFREREMYSKVSPDNKDKPSYFEIEVIIGKKVYAYGFEMLLHKGAFLTEWLYELSEDKESKIFERNIKEQTIEFSDAFSGYSLDRLKIYGEDIKSNHKVLFLTIMNQNKADLYERFNDLSMLNDVYRWIDEDLVIITPNTFLNDYNLLSENGDFSKLQEIMHSFATGITSVEMRDISAEEALQAFPKEYKEDLLQFFDREFEKVEGQRDVPQQLLLRNPEEFYIVTKNGDDFTWKTIGFTHNNKGIYFGINEESDGTRRLLDLLSILFEDGPKTFVVDEFDRCLHSNLTLKFIELYYDRACSRNTQLIMTTHETRIQDTDLLRRDQIWFTEKEEDGNTKMYSLEEFKVRSDKKIDRAYLEGRYGAVPRFNQYFRLN